MKLHLGQLASKTYGGKERDQVGFLTACQCWNVSVSAELVRWESPLECVCFTAEGVTISWQGRTLPLSTSPPAWLCVHVLAHMFTWSESVFSVMVEAGLGNKTLSIFQCLDFFKSELLFYGGRWTEIKCSFPLCVPEHKRARDLLSEGC